MKRLLVGLLLAVLASTPVESAGRDDAGARALARETHIAQAAEAMRPELVSRRRDMHTHPELSNREVRTGKLVADRLRELGLEVQTGVAGNGVVGILKGGRPGPVVAVRADLDALPIQEVNDVPYKSVNPGVKHACGHDAHTTIELGVAEVLVGMRAQIPGTIKFIFQPAEEGAPPGEEGGAALMIKQGVLDNPRPAAIFGLHVLPYLQVGKVSYKSGPVMASADKFTIHIHGKGSHGALPENGVDAVVVASECVAALQTIRSRRVGTLEPLVLSIGTIKGGLRHNIIADEVTMEGTLRTLNETIRSEVKETMRTTLAGITSAYGATFDLSFDESAAVTFNDPGLVEETVPEFERVLGKSSVTVTPATLVSEDFSYYQKVIPGFFFFLGVGNESRGFTAQLHTAEFDLDEDALVIGVKVMSNVILDYLERHAVS